jgi:hypothetical protein
MSIMLSVANKRIMLSVIMLNVIKPSVVSPFSKGKGDLRLQKEIMWGAQKLMGDNLKVVWAEFSTLSLAVLIMSATAW